MSSSAPLPPDEPARLHALAALDLLDSPPDPDFDRFTRLAAADLDCPIALVSLVDAARQWFKSRLGLAARETPRDQSFCAHALLERQPLVVPDALDDARFSDNPLVTGPPHIRFYMGVPIVSRGHALGTLCVIDTRPRAPTPSQIDRLVDLARLVEHELELRRVTRELARAQATFRELADALPLPLVIQRDRRLLYANRAAAALVEVGEPEALVGRRTDEFLDPADLAIADERTTTITRDLRPVAERDFRLRGPRGRDILVTAMGLPLRYDDEPAVATIMRDVTRLRQLEADERTAVERVAHERALLTGTLSSIHDGVALLSADRRLLYANPRYFELLGLDPHATVGLTREALADHLAARSDDPAEVRARFLDVANREERDVAHAFELTTPRRLVLERRVAAAPSPEHLVVVWRDITAQEDLALERTRLARTDPLTRLLNRRGLEALLPRERARARRLGVPQSVIVLDIDRFKALNDTHGHLVGDRVLTAVADTIVATCRATDLVVRWGGEQLLVWLDGGSEGASLLAERIREAVARAEPEGLAVTVSGGVATLESADEPLEAAIARADALLYEAKRAGRNRIVWRARPARGDADQ